MCVVRLRTQPENLVLDRHGVMKVVDFGFAKYLAPGSRTTTLCGTPGEEGRKDSFCLHAPFLTLKATFSLGAMLRMRVILCQKGM